MARILSHVRGLVILAAMENKKQVYIGLEDDQVVESRRLHGYQFADSSRQGSRSGALLLRNSGIR